MAASLHTRPVVWIVDDSPLDAERARRVLEGHYVVEVFGDGSALLEHLAAHPEPDVLVLDWVMPGVSGIEVCREFAQMEEAAHKMERDRVDMANLIAETVDDFRPLVDNTHQEMLVEVQGAHPIVLGDRRRLQQVLTNLIANAIKFTPAGGKITVRANCPGPVCEVRIEDNGMGIPAEIVPTLFQRYTRAPSGKRDAGGTGLGLLIVREIVEAHGGTVGVESAPGQGSKFWFRLPAAEVGQLGRPRIVLTAP